MTPRSEKQFETIRHQKRDLIMDTGLELFASAGFENTTISMIAKKANISKGLLYNYYTSKEELLEAILNKGIDEMIAIFDPNKDGALDNLEMEFFIRETFRMIKEKRIFYKLFISISFQASAFKLIEKRTAELIGPLTQIMNNYFKENSFDNPVVETYIFSSLMDGIAFDYIMAPDIYPLDMVVEEFIKRYCKKQD